MHLVAQCRGNGIVLRVRINTFSAFIRTLSSRFNILSLVMLPYGSTRDRSEDCVTRLICRACRELISSEQAMAS